MICSILNVFLIIPHKPPIRRFIISLFFDQFWGILIPYAKVIVWNVSINVFADWTCKSCFKWLYGTFDDQRKGGVCKWCERQASGITKTNKQFECKLFFFLISYPNPTTNEEKWCPYANNSNWIAQQDGPEICGTVNGVEKVPSRIGAKLCGEKRRTAEMERAASWCATFGLSLCSLSLKYSKPLLQAQPSHPLWLSIIAILSFTLFACAATVMLLVGARFTHTQIIVMLIAFFALLLA